MTAFLYLLRAETQINSRFVKSKPLHDQVRFIDQVTTATAFDFKLLLSLGFDLPPLLKWKTLNCPPFWVNKLRVFTKPAL